MSDVGMLLLIGVEMIVVLFVGANYFMNKFEEMLNKFQDVDITMRKYHQDSVSERTVLTHDLVQVRRDLALLDPAKIDNGVTAEAPKKD